MTLVMDLAEAYLELAAEHDLAGRIHLAEKERESVRMALWNSVAKEPKDAQALNSLAWSLAIRDLYLDDTLEAASLAAELEPESPEILDTLAEVHWRRGEFDVAIRVGRRALDLSPDDNYLIGQL